MQIYLSGLDSLIGWKSPFQLVYSWLTFDQETNTIILTSRYIYMIQAWRRPLLKFISFSFKLHPIWSTVTQDCVRSLKSSVITLWGTWLKSCSPRNLLFSTMNNFDDFFNFLALWMLARLNISTTFSKVRLLMAVFSFWAFKGIYRHHHKGQDSSVHSLVFI